MKWYYAKDGSQQGPVGTEDLQSKIAAGQVAATDLVWRDGMKDWLPVSEVGDFANYLPQAEAAPAPPAQPGQLITGANPAAASPYQAPAAPSYGGAAPGMPVQNYLWQSIVVTILCCWPFGIPAIVYAAKVDGLVSRGQYAEAQEASKNAKMWCWVSFGSWFVAIGLYLLLVIVAGSAQM